MSTQRLQIVPMRAAHVDAVMDVERLAHRTPWSRQVFVEELHREWAHVDLVLDGDKVLAFCNYWLVHDEVHILNVATHPDQRRKGYARRLLEHVLHYAKRKSCRFITLEVRRANHGAQELYRLLGFGQIGVRPRYYADDGEDAIVMMLELHPDGP
jgi:[ribosomal protein S18]-alanine N-acetyltransferase